jgi:predicted dehydrogenase
MATQERIRIALIGTGKRGRNVRLPAIRMMSDRFELVAVCDMHEQTARRVAAECGVPAYSRVQDLVAHERLDAAAISTPGDSHHAIGAYLAERGISIIVETPLAATLPLCDALIEAVERNGVKLEVAEQYCRDPLHLMKRQIVEQGLIGDVLRVFALFQTDGCHIVSSLRMFLGDAAATRVGSVSMNSPIPRVNANAVRRFDTEEWNLQTMEFDSGAIAVTSYSNLYHAQALGRKAKTLFQIDGTTGSIVEDDVHLTTEEQRLDGGGRATAYPIRTVTREDGGTAVVERLQIDTDPPVVWENPWPQYRTNASGLAIVEEMDSLAQAVAEDRPTRYDARRARADIEISMAAAESWKPGRGPVELPLTSVTDYEEQLHEKFRHDHGCDPCDLDRVVDVFFPEL